MEKSARNFSEMKLLMLSQRATIHSSGFLAQHWVCHHGSWVQFSQIAILFRHDALLPTLDSASHLFNLVICDYINFTTDILFLCGIKLAEEEVFHLAAVCRRFYISHNDLMVIDIGPFLILRASA